MDFNLLDNSTELSPMDSEYWFNKGEALFDQSKYDEAVECFTKAIELNPYVAEYWNKKGNSLRRLGKYAGALECYDKAVNLEPNRPLYWNNKGWALHDLGRYAEAIKCFDEAIKLEDFSIDKVLYMIRKATVLEKISYDEASKYRKRIKEEYINEFVFLLAFGVIDKEEFGKFI